MRTLSSVTLGAYSLVTYQPDRIDDDWEQIAPLIQRAIDHYPGDDGFDIEQIYDGLCEARFQLWTCQSDRVDAAVVTAICGPAIKIIAAGGTALDIWKNWLPEVAKFGREHGCTRLEIDGRRGWLRALGFNEVFTRMTRAI